MFRKSYLVIFALLLIDSISAKKLLDNENDLDNKGSNNKRNVHKRGVHHYGYGSQPLAGLQYGGYHTFAHGYSHSHLPVGIAPTYLKSPLYGLRSPYSTYSPYAGLTNSHQPFVLRPGNAVVSSYNVNYPRYRPVASIAPISPISFAPISPVHVAPVATAAPVLPVGVGGPLTFGTNYFVPSRPLLPSPSPLPAIPVQRPVFVTPSVPASVPASFPGVIPLATVGPSIIGGSFSPDQIHPTVTSPTQPTLPEQSPWRPIFVSPSQNPSVPPPSIGHGHDHSSRPSITLLPPHSTFESIQGQYIPPQEQYQPPQSQYLPPQGGQHNTPQGQYHPPQGQYLPPQHGQYLPPPQGK